MRIELAGNVHAPAAARRFVFATLAQLGPVGATRSDDVVLVVSELVTNSVRAGAQAIDVDLVETEDRVELQVTDDAPGWPTVRHPDWEDPAGRGLAIVEEVADEWHASDLPRGKRVTVRWSRATAGCAG